MTNLHGLSAQTTGSVGTLVSMGIIDSLVAKGVLSRGEAKAILESAIQTLSTRQQVPTAAEAASFIRNQILPRYAE